MILYLRAFVVNIRISSKLKNSITLSKKRFSVFNEKTAGLVPSRFIFTAYYETSNKSYFRLEDSPTGGYACM